MGWKEAKSQYKKGRMLTGQGSEDIIARRVLRGLGFVQKDIYSLEHALFSEVYENDTLWARTQKVLKALYTRNGLGHLYRTWYIEATDDSLDGKDTKHRLSVANEMEPATQPVVFCRIKNSKTALVYTLVDSNDITEYTPPYRVIGLVSDDESQQDAHPRLILTQEAEHFIAQFGPYKVEELRKT